ncbi:hypothetical protein ACWC0A_22440 [Streptomyces scopuliridis]
MAAEKPRTQIPSLCWIKQPDDVRRCTENKDHDGDQFHCYSRTCWPRQAGETQTRGDRERGEQHAFQAVLQADAVITGSLPDTLGTVVRDGHCWGRQGCVACRKGAKVCSSEATARA